MAAIVKIVRKSLRRLLGALPPGLRYPLLRRLVRVEPAPAPRLTLKIAETREELEACFRVLHDAYVGEGFMEPDPSGLRVTLYHALPTTTTLLAKLDDQVVGTISLVRESALGFPLQKIVHLGAVRRTGGTIAEVSALAVDRRYQREGGTIMFPLMKFMYEYARRCFDTRHLVIAVNPNRIALYEALLFFERLTENPVANYDFANGAPAVGAHIDLQLAPERLRRHYGGKSASRNLFHYFVELAMPNIQFPDKRFFTSTDPVMTPELLDYFFNRRTRVFAATSRRERRLLHKIYDLPGYRHVLPPLESKPAGSGDARRHRRFTVTCPADIVYADGSAIDTIGLTIVECSVRAFRARAERPLPLSAWGEVRVDLGRCDTSTLWVRAIRMTRNELTYIVEIGKTDESWLKFVNALYKGATNADLEHATRLLG